VSISFLRNVLTGHGQQSIESYRGLAEWLVHVTASSFLLFLQFEFSSSELIDSVCLYENVSVLDCLSFCAYYSDCFTISVIDLFATLVILVVYNINMFE
jgi:hypothetical protein